MHSKQAPLLFALLFVLALNATAATRKSAPDFRLKDVDGNEVVLSKLRGRVIFLDFWASWCGPCRNSIPSVEQLYQKFKSKKVLFYGINLENNPSRAKNFAKNSGINYKILNGDRKTTDSFGVRGIPAFFIIDKEGKIAASYVGFDPSLSSVWETEIKKLLAEPDNPKPPPAEPKRKY